MAECELELWVNDEPAIVAFSLIGDEPRSYVRTHGDGDVIRMMATFAPRIVRFLYADTPLRREINRRILSRRIHEARQQMLNGTIVRIR